MPDGRVVTLHGRLAVQWRSGDEKLRAAIVRHIEETRKRWASRQGQ